MTAGLRARFLGLPIFIVGVVVLLLVRAGALNATHRAEARIQDEVEVIEGNALASVRLIDRMRLDEEALRSLLDTHIRAKATAEMEDLERQIAANEADYAAAARAYDPLSTFPGEHAAWQRLLGDEARMHEQSLKVLQLSRRNKDQAAQVSEQEFESGLYTFERDGRAVADINAAEAARSKGRIAALHQSLHTRISILDSVGFAAMVGMVFLAAVYARRRTEDARHAVELENRNKELDAFAGRVAHDLRGPLTALTLISAKLKSQSPSEDPTVNRLQRSVDRMELLIKDLLDLSRVDTYTNKGTCDPELVVAELSEELRPRIDAEGGALRIDLAPSLVNCVQGLLRQALWNITDNAMKYRRSDVPPQIEITGRILDGWYQVCISDNGPGMAPEESRQVFQPFFRGAQAKNHSGTGLGLSLVKRVMEANGGMVSVRSLVGQGTTFVLALPLVQVRSGVTSNAQTTRPAAGSTSSPRCPST